MKLWDIKANALRLMFADSDIMFSEEEFESGAIYENGNTRDKLIRMNDSIARAIDLYYQYCGQYTGKQKVKYVLDEEGKATYVLDISEITNFGSPIKVEVLGNPNIRVRGNENIYYYYDHIKKEITTGFSAREKVIDLTKVEFMLHYNYAKMNLPDVVDELTFDLDDIFIPLDVQRMIPKYIKGEIYEEDEYAIAQISKNEYIQYLISRERKFGNVQTKVKSIYRRG